MFSGNKVCVYFYKNRWTSISETNTFDIKEYNQGKYENSLFVTCLAKKTQVRSTFKTLICGVKGNILVFLLRRTISDRLQG